MNRSYDVIIIGSGPGGYVAAARAGQLGLKTACVEREARLGGVCLNVGCIPSKALLDSSEYYHLARTGLAEHGIKPGRLSLDLAAMMARKDKVVADLTANVARLLEAVKVEVIHAKAMLAGGGRVAVTTPDGKTTELEAKAIVLATGSRPVALPMLPFDGRRAVSSTEALAFETVPKTLGVVGGGYIGLELGSVWQRLGTRVTVIEALPHIAAGLDGQVRRVLDRSLRQQGMELLTGAKLVNGKVGKDQVAVAVQVEGKTKKLSFERLLVAVGRRPLTEGLGLEAAGVAVDPATGWVKTDAGYRTTADGVYAIGDLIAGPMLAHKASAEGTAVAEILAGRPAEVNYDAIPAVVYTYPEAASVGLTEQQAKDRQIPCCTAVYPFAGAGRARCMGATEGLVKIVVHSQTDRLLGAHIIGARAADMRICSRRTAEALILQARVKVNHRVVTVLGTKVDPAGDVVEVDGQPVGRKDQQGKRIYIALHKPKGFVTSCRHAGQSTIMDLVDVAQRVFPIGRLDKDSSGLLLLTNDGPLHHRLSHPSFDHEKVYEVVVAGPITDKALAQLAAGLVLDGKPTRPARVKRMGLQRFEIVLREGRKRQIRRMVEALDNRVMDLKRIGFAGIDLGRLAPGTWRHLSPGEVEGLVSDGGSGKTPQSLKSRGPGVEKAIKHPGISPKPGAGFKGGNRHGHSARHRR